MAEAALLAPPHGLSPLSVALPLEASPPLFRRQPCCTWSLHAWGLSLLSQATRLSRSRRACRLAVCRPKGSSCSCPAITQLCPAAAINSPATCDVYAVASLV
eukprot:356199-Chlamydomonas_euryale.AAC.2